jgi:hypothetical protein
VGTCTRRGARRARERGQHSAVGSRSSPNQAHSEYVRARRVRVEPRTAAAAVAPATLATLTSEARSSVRVRSYKEAHSMVCVCEATRRHTA